MQASIQKISLEGVVSLFKNKDGQIRSGWIIAGVTLACFLIAFILAIPAGFIVIFVNIIRNDTLNFAEVVGNSVHVMNIVGIYSSRECFLQFHYYLEVCLKAANGKYGNWAPKGPGRFAGRPGL